MDSRVYVLFGCYDGYEAPDLLGVYTTAEFAEHAWDAFTRNVEENDEMEYSGCLIREVKVGSLAAVHFLF